MLCPQDPSILNELGVVHMQLNRLVPSRRRYGFLRAMYRLDDGLRSLRQAAEEVLRGAASGSNRRNSTTGSVEVRNELLYARSPDDNLLFISYRS